MVASLGRTRSSSLRELMSSLMKTLRKWYLTVRGLMNKRVADERVPQVAARERTDRDGAVLRDGRVR